MIIDLCMTTEFLKKGCFNNFNYAHSFAYNNIILRLFCTSQYYSLVYHIAGYFLYGGNFCIFCIYSACVQKLKLRKFNL